MSLVALVSAKHSPGVTTTAVALACVWPQRQVLVVECDPAGGDLAALSGLALEPGLTTLAASRRHDLAPGDIASHVQPLPCGARAIVAPPSPDGVRAALATLSDQLGQRLAQMGDLDVLADCGRLDPNSPATSLLEAADLALLVARPTLGGVEHVASRLGRPRSWAPRLGLVLIGEKPHLAKEVAAYLDCEVIGVVADDPRAAEQLLAGTAARRLERTLFMRSARSLAEALAVRLAAAPERQRAVGARPVRLIDRPAVDRAARR